MLYVNYISIKWGGGDIKKSFSLLPGFISSSKQPTVCKGGRQIYDSHKEIYYLLEAFKEGFLFRSLPLQNVM